MSDLKSNTNTLMVINVSWAPKLDQNLLSTILLAKKGIEVFLKKVSQPSEIIVDDEVFGLANIIGNLYVIWLAKNPKPETVNRVTAPTIEI